MTEHKMDPELKQKWLDALRGGDYAQHRGELFDGTSGFCCLGVLADVAGVLDDFGTVCGGEYNLGNRPKDKVPYPSRPSMRMGTWPRPRRSSSA